MKTVSVSCTDVPEVGASSSTDFIRQVKAASPVIKSVFRDGFGFRAAAENGVECRIEATDLSKAFYDAWFHAGGPFVGSVNLPEAADFGIAEPVVIDDESDVVETPVEAAKPPVASVPPASKPVSKPVK